MEHTPITPVSPAGAGIGPVRSEPADAVKVRALAQQFEAMLLSQMMREMRDSMAPDADRGGLGGPILADTMNTELGLALSRSGGLGLAEVLAKALEAHRPADDEAALAAATPALAAARPVEAGLPVTVRETVLLPQAVAAVTSDFGWRADPIHGQARFHGGVDLGYAYGREVHAAAGGVVTFAGEKGGYGTTVIIDHGRGLETRYAHLSAAAVREGDRIDAGALIARSGNSGRVTGPHLHFEVRQDGRPVDPDVIGSPAGAVETEAGANRR